MDKNNVKQLIENAVLGLIERNESSEDKFDVPLYNVRLEEMSEKQVSNALSHFAAGCKAEDIVVFSDMTIFHNGKKGLLFSTEGFYYYDLNLDRKNNPLPQPVRYEELIGVALETQDNFYLIYRDGRREEAYSLYSYYMVTALQRILAVLEFEELQPADHYTEVAEEEDYDTMESLLQAAEQGDARAQHTYGSLYYYGENVEKNMETALMWYEKAAEQGYARALYDCGQMYLSGEGTEKNMVKGLMLIKEAAKQGLADAQCYLGSAYQYGGDDVPQNKWAAQKWYKLAAAQGDFVAEDRLNALKNYRL